MQSCALVCSNLRICNLRINHKNVQICYLRTGTSNKFAIADRAKEFSDLQFTDFKMFPCPFLVLTLYGSKSLHLATVKKLYTSCSQKADTLQQKSLLCIPRKGIARPHSQFPHSCVCDRFLYSQGRTTYFPAAERQTDRGNI
jgi:hypothetical protein